MSLAVVISLALLWQSWYCHNVIYHLSDGGRVLMIAHNLFTTHLYQSVDIKVIQKKGTVLLYLASSSALYANICSLPVCIDIGVASGDFANQ